MHILTHLKTAEHVFKCLFNFILIIEKLEQICYESRTYYICIFQHLTFLFYISNSSRTNQITLLGIKDVCRTNHYYPFLNESITYHYVLVLCYYYDTSCLVLNNILIIIFKDNAYFYIFPFWHDVIMIKKVKPH